MNIERELNNFEKALVEFIIENEAEDYLEDLKCLKVKNREVTGVGVYVEFCYLDNDPNLIKDKKTLTLGKSIYIEIDGLNDGAGGLLYIDNGRISMLECYTHGSELWPLEVSKFKITFLD